jgi:hypothetical protein
MTLQQDLFINSDNIQTANLTKTNTNLIKIAEKLAIRFTEIECIPAKYKKTTKKVKLRKNSDESKIQIKFSANITAWHKVIKTLFDKVDKVQAWRFINTEPIIEPDIKNVTLCKDFIDFYDYLILRRDKENCDDDELGNLAMLHTAFQRKIEYRISTTIQEKP